MREPRTQIDLKVMILVKAPRKWVLMEKKRSQSPRALQSEVVWLMRETSQEPENNEENWMWCTECQVR